jgi:hypothetical protein
MTFLHLSAILMIATALTHSILGERRLIAPVLAIDHPMMRAPLVGSILRGAWHLTSILMALNALAIAWPGTPEGLIRATGGVWLGIGLLDAVLTKGKHVGWPLLALSGLFAVIGVTS